MMMYLALIETQADRDKFEDIYYQYRGLMMYISLKYLRNKMDAEDAVHESFIKIATTIETVDTSISKRLKVFICIITERTCKDMCRKRKQQSRLDLAECSSITIEYTGCNQLTACMTKLSPKYRSVILLKYLYGYTPQEIAQILGLTEANVYKIHLRGKDKLHALCKQEGLL